MTTPLLSLPTEILDTITQYVATGATPQEAAANAIGWGRVSTLTQQMTRVACISGVITHAKDQDDSLVILWKRWLTGYSRRTAIPEITAASQIREWMKNPDSATLLAIVDGVTLHQCEKLKVIPSAINIFYSLISLDITYSQITQIGPQAFIGCPALKRLKLQYNQITQIDSKAFEGCGALELLNLTSNKIAQIGPRLFTGCPVLEMLYLQNNQIRQIAFDAFEGCLSLQRLELCGNPILLTNLELPEAVAKIVYPPLSVRPRDPLMDLADATMQRLGLAPLHPTTTWHGKKWTKY